MVTKTRGVKRSSAGKNSKKEVIRMKKNLKTQTKKSNLKEVNKMTEVIKKAEPAVAFCRVSTDGTIKPSLIFKEKEILKYSNAHNLQIIKNYECIETGWNKKDRQKTTEMLKYISRHPEIKHIIFYSVEIINRNFIDKKRIYAFAKINNKSIHFVKSNKIYTKSSSPDELLAYEFELTILQKISNDIAKKTTMGMLEKAKYGILPLKAPFGYTNNPRTKMIDINNKTGQKIKEVFEILSQENVSKEDFINLSIKLKINPRKLINIIRNPFYYGDFFYKENLYQGKHIPLVSRAVWINTNKNLNEII